MPGSSDLHKLAVGPTIVEHKVNKPNLPFVELGRSSGTHERLPDVQLQPRQIPSQIDHRLVRREVILALVLITRSGEYRVPVSLPSNSVIVQAIRFRDSQVPYRQRC